MTKSNHSEAVIGEPIAQTIDTSTSSKKNKSRFIAGILGLTLGGFGFHNFYLGFYRHGFFQFLLATVGSLLTHGFTYWLAQIWGIIEGVLILCQHRNYTKDAHGVKLTN